MAVTLGDRAGRQLFDLLCRAAGVDELKVTAITVRVGIKDIARFEIETNADDATLASALKGEVPRLPYSPELRAELVKQFTQQ